VSQSIPEFVACHEVELNNLLMGADDTGLIDVATAGAVSADAVPLDLVGFLSVGCQGDDNPSRILPLLHCEVFHCVVLRWGFHAPLSGVLGGLGEFVIEPTPLFLCLVVFGVDNLAPDFLSDASA
jgi:hypothetical protein